MEAGESDVVSLQTHRSTHHCAVFRQLVGQCRQLTPTHVLQHMLPVSVVTYLRYPSIICHTRSNKQSVYTPISTIIVISLIIFLFPKFRVLYVCESHLFTNQVLLQS